MIKFNKKYFNEIKNKYKFFSFVVFFNYRNESFGLEVKLKIKKIRKKLHIQKVLSL